MYSDTARKSFNDNWMFSEPGTKASAEKIPARVVPVNLPHAWNEIGWNYEKWKPEAPAGTGWYYKVLPQAGIKANSFLRFEGVSAECEIYLNGDLLYHNLGAYQPFEVPLSGYHNNASNLLAIKVTDKPSLKQLSPDESDPFVKSPRYKTWVTPIGSSRYAGGIWRDAWLVSADESIMSTPLVKAYKGKVTVAVDIKGPFGNLHCAIFDCDGKKVAEAEGQDEISMVIEDWRSWHPVSPSLYSLQTILKNQAGDEIQRITQPVAFFDFQIRDSDFHVNGMPYFLRGQNGFPHCNIAHDREYISKYVGKIKKQGVEISRFHTEPPSHAWLDECDRHGIMVIFEMPLHGSIGCYAFGNKQFSEQALKEICALVKEYRRHPSIAMWSLGNELIVAPERDAGLGVFLFDILEGWCREVRKFDRRPIIANSGGDAVNEVQKSIGDVDDFHHYGGWYVENIRELDNYAYFTRKNERFFQPMIVTESVAAYTDNNGEFMIHDETDIRQRKIVAMRLGKINKLREQSLAAQAFILKEYAEAMWRVLGEKSNFSGYIPFGQYTWFFDPFDKSENGMREKPIWDIYRKVMSPVHVQFECWNRHIATGKSLRGRLLLCHEDISLPAKIEMTVILETGNDIIYRDTLKLSYHRQASRELDLPLHELPAGDNRLQISVFFNNKKIAENYLDFKVYNFAENIDKNTKKVYYYDPADKLQLNGVRLEFPQDIAEYDPTDSIFILTPYSLDENVTFSAGIVRKWCAEGGKVAVLEQNPGPHSNNILNTGISVIRKTQPYWSRWASNMVKHTDRADICDASHVMFDGLTEADMSWWNDNTYLAHNYLSIVEKNQDNSRARVLSRIGNGLLPNELMPVDYEFLDSGYSITAFEIPLGKGSILISSLLLGSKSATEPVARKIIANLLKKS